MFSNEILGFEISSLRISRKYGARPLPPRRHRSIAVCKHEKCVIDSFLLESFVVWGTNETFVQKITGFVGRSVVESVRVALSWHASLRGAVFGCVRLTLERESSHFRYAISDLLGFITQTWSTWYPCFGACYDRGVSCGTPSKQNWALIPGYTLAI